MELEFINIILIEQEAFRFKSKASCFRICQGKIKLLKS